MRPSAKQKADDGGLRRNHMNYDQWNNLLSQWFFNREMKDQQVFLYITPEVLQQISQPRIGSISVDEAVRDFCTAVASKARSDICKSACDWAQDEEWRRSHSDCPPYLGFLALFVLAFTRRAALEGRGYYEKLNKLLRAYGYDGCDVNTARFSETSAAWNDLQEWTHIRKNGSIGLFKFRRITWPHVGMPAAQALINIQDIEKLDDFFGGLNRTGELTSRDLVERLANCRQRFLSSATATQLFEGDSEVQDAIAELLLSLWDEYRSRPPRIRIQRARRNPIVRKPGEVEVTATVLLASFLSFRTGQHVMCLVIEIDRDQPRDELEIHFAGMSWRAEKFREVGTTAFYGPVLREIDPDSGKIEYLYPSADEPSPYDFIIEFHGGELWLVKEAIREKPFFLEEDNESNVEFLQADEGSLECSKTYICVAPFPALDAGLANFFVRHNVDKTYSLKCQNIPRGWCAFKITIQSLDNLIRPSQTPRLRNEIKVIGGIRVDKGNARIYQSFAPPFIICDSTQTLSVTDGVRQISARRSAGHNHFEIPEELHQPGEIMVWATDVKGHRDDSIQQVVIELADAAMPTSYKNLPCAGFSSASSCGLADEKEISEASVPTYLFDAETVCVEFVGGERFGRQNVFKLGNLPRIRVSGLAVGALENVALVCGDQSLDLGADETWSLPAKLCPGEHHLHILWFGSIIKSLLFEVRDIPDVDLLISGALKLTTHIKGQHEFLVTQANVVLSVEPQEEVHVRINGAVQNLPCQLTRYIAHNPNVDIQLVWRGTEIKSLGFVFHQTAPVVHVTFPNKSLESRVRSFARHDIPLVSVEVVPQVATGEIRLSCDGEACRRHDELAGIYVLPDNLLAGKKLKFSCEWRGVEIPITSPEFELLDPPAVTIAVHGGRTNAHGSYYQGRFPSVSVGGRNESVVLTVNGCQTVCDEHEFILDLKALVIVGQNVVLATWRGRVLANLVFDVIQVPKLQLELAGGCRIADGKFLMLSNSEMPEIIGDAAQLQKTLNGSVFHEDHIPLVHCLHGKNELQVSGFPGTTRFEAWKEVRFVGSQIGQITEPTTTRPAWNAVWIIAKFGKYVSAAFLPHAELSQPETKTVMPRRDRSQWCEEILKADLLNTSQQERKLWNAYRECARRNR